MFLYLNISLLLLICFNMAYMYSFLVYIGALHNISVSTDIVIVRVSIFNASYLFFQRIYNVYILLLH